MTERMDGANFGPGEMPESEADLFEDLPSAEKMRDAAAAILEEARAGLLDKLNKDEKKSRAILVVGLLAITAFAGERIPELRAVISTLTENSNLDMNLNIFRAFGVDPGMAAISSVVQLAGQSFRNSSLEENIASLERRMGATRSKQHGQ